MTSVVGGVVRRATLQPEIANFILRLAFDILEVDSTSNYSPSVGVAARLRCSGDAPVVGTLELNDLTDITHDVIETARASLIIGTT